MSTNSKAIQRKIHAENNVCFENVMLTHNVSHHIYGEEETKIHIRNEFRHYVSILEIK